MVISTRVDTRKYEFLVNNPTLALLLHGNDNSPPIAFSVTLNGRAVLQQGHTAERYRAAHLSRNPCMAQFINGENIRIFAISLDGASISDIQDNVARWKRDGSS